MFATLAALFLAHVLADFVLQTDAMVKAKSAPLMLAKHGAVVLVTAAAATGALSPWLLALTVVHLIIDVAKARAPRTIWAFLADQGAHAATIIAAAALIPMHWPDPAAAIMALIAGAVLATRAGGYAVGLLMEPWAADIAVGLTGAGRVIGNLERGLIFLLILTGQTQNIGFLIAAKSVLRFGSVNDDRKFSDYVIIGTLASFGWAIAASFATLRLLAALPPIGIPGLTP